MRWIKTHPSIPIPFDETMLYKGILIMNFIRRINITGQCLYSWLLDPDIMKLALTTYNVCTT